MVDPQRQRRAVPGRAQRQRPVAVGRMRGRDLVRGRTAFPNLGNYAQDPSDYGYASDNQGIVR